FELLDEHRQESRQLLLGRRRVGLCVEKLQHTRIMRVFRLVADNMGQALAHEGPVLLPVDSFLADLSGYCTFDRAHDFHLPRVYSSWVRTCRMNILPV